jgi:hypothetical protein
LVEKADRIRALRLTPPEEALLCLDRAITGLSHSDFDSIPTFEG